MKFSLSTCFLVSLCLIIVSNANSWDYDDLGNDWPLHFPTCNGKKQSPVNVDTTAQTSCDTTKRSSKIYLNWEIDREKTEFLLKNNGMTLQVIPFSFDSSSNSAVDTFDILHNKNNVIANLTNPLYDTYKHTNHRFYCFDSIHFHWGNTSGQGSEHTLNGKSYPLELHFVHFSCDYNTLADALKALPTDPYVLSVVGVFFEIGENNTALAKIIDDSNDFNDILTPSSSKKSHQLKYSYASFNLTDLVPGYDRQSGEFDGVHNSIISYYGSLTTPPCSQVVRWNVMDNPLTVSEYQMTKFRQLLQSQNQTINKTESNNYRPVQPLNGRSFYSCQSDIKNVKHSSKKNDKKEEKHEKDKEKDREDSVSEERSNKDTTDFGE